MFGLFGKEKGNSTAAVVEHLQPQLHKIRAKGQRFHINDVTLAYISTVHMALSKNTSVNTEQLRTVVDQIFPDKEYEMSKGNAFISVTMGHDDYYRKVGGLLPIAEKEIKSGGGDYYVRYNEYALKATEALFECGEDYDPSTAEYDPDDYLKV